MLKEKEDLKLQISLKKEKLREKGITLVALVVTIIILLILAGVTLDMVLSQNGLFSRAQNAVEMYKKAQEDEEKMLDNLEAVMEGKTIEEISGKENFENFRERVNQGENFDKI